MKFSQSLKATSCNKDFTLKPFDLFGKPVKLTQFGEDTLRSTTGGCCSIVILAVTLLFFTQRLVVLASGSSN